MEKIDDNIICNKTYTRSMEVVAKAGFKEGAADGQKFTFQSSFDMGYSQGMNFGLVMGLNTAKKSIQNLSNVTDVSHRYMNCQICLNGMLPHENVYNMFNFQKEQNESMNSIKNINE